MPYEPGKYSPPEIPASNGSPEHPIPSSALYITRFQSRLVMADQTTIQSAYATSAGGEGRIWVWIPPASGKTMAQVFAIFDDAAKTQQIESYATEDGDPTVFTGYTALDTIKSEVDGTISVRMKRPPAPEPEE